MKLSIIIAIILLIFEYFKFGLISCISIILGVITGTIIAQGCIYLEEKISTKINLRRKN